MSDNNFQQFMQMKDEDTPRVKRCGNGHVWIPVTDDEPKGCPVCKRKRKEKGGDEAIVEAAKAEEKEVVEQDFSISANRRKGKKRGSE